MSAVENTIKSIDAVREKSESAILFCSFGKDSLVLLDLLNGRFKHLTVVFMYFVKDLEHISRWIKWAEIKYGIKVLQVPHWNLSYILRSGLYCVPNPRVKLIRLKEVIEAIRAKTGSYYVFLGMKMADGMNRRLMLKGYRESLYENKGLCYPLAEWNQKDILSYMKQHRLPEPVRYSLKASNGVGFSLDCFLWLRENYPQDLERIYQVFPMSRRILFEYDNKQNNNG